jgi:hypothetical protein
VANFGAKKGSFFSFGAAGGKTKVHIFVKFCAKFVFPGPPSEKSLFFGPKKTSKFSAQKALFCEMSLKRPKIDFFSTFFDFFYRKFPKNRQKIDQIFDQKIPKNAKKCQKL